MKNLKHLLFLLPIILLSCSSNDDDSQEEIPAPTFAMTAKINGTDYFANNPYGTNLFSNTNIYDYYPLADFVMLQGRYLGQLFGNPEINIWLKRTQIAVGTYPVTTSTNNPSTHAIDLTDLANGDQFEYTISGSITITEVDTTLKTVKGTFQFTAADSPSSTVINNTVTNGTFNYKYAN